MNNANKMDLTPLSTETPIRLSTTATSNEGEFKHEVRQFQKPYDNQQAEQISLMV